MTKAIKDQDFITGFNPLKFDKGGTHTSQKGNNVLHMQFLGGPNFQNKLSYYGKSRQGYPALVPFEIYMIEQIRGKPVDWQNDELEDLFLEMKGNKIIAEIQEEASKATGGIYPKIVKVFNYEKNIDLYKNQLVSYEMADSDKTESKKEDNKVNDKGEKQFDESFFDMK